MTPPIQFFAHGIPKAQPRPRACRRGAFSGVYDPGTAEAWKFSVREAAKSVWDGRPLFGPLKVAITFWFPRPKSHFRTGKHADQLRPNAPHRHTTKPDRDNLEKAVLDALSTIGIWQDDCQVCAGEVCKFWQAGPTTPGCLVTIAELEDAP